ncbi:splicing factor ESS-2 homolog [Ruditapes philippinarum]|uniref:splicing factor ESS-2 homolog n=1 Tax=Ruditapes philippinarum TaxID=129788 RepID=UPI00295A9ABD|nr:splicing factor ESS-2 homolog [Ruditapes philippinarum]
MDLVKVCSKALVVAKPKGSLGPEKKKVNVLDEEKYTEELEKIIEKDFYPDLPKMKAQSEYFEALENNDLVKLRELEMRYSKRPDTVNSVFSSPANFDTPDRGERPRTRRPDTGQSHVSHSRGEEKTTNDEKPEVKVHLDSFLSKNTSEDNDSFKLILEEADKKHKEKHAWLFENEVNRTQEEEDRLALPNIEQQAAITDGKAGVDTWKYKTRNHVMYIPEGEDLSSIELLELKKKKPRKIFHENTRFHLNPWNTQRSKEMIKQAASEKTMQHSGRIGHDGKELEIGMTPKVNGYGFVATPSPAPGVDESPLMTWGEIEGTPFQLDPSETPLVPSDAPAFKIPDVPKRDQLAIELAEKSSRQHRDKKKNALMLASRLASPIQGHNRKSSLERISSLSPAAQRLLGSRIGVRTGTDKALRESYSPSPSHRHSGYKTPKLTPKLTPKSKTPSMSTPSGSSTPGSATPGSERGESATPFLTDNLLQLPKKRLSNEEPLNDGKKRLRATDFF